MVFRVSDFLGLWRSSNTDAYFCNSIFIFVFDDASGISTSFRNADRGVVKSCNYEVFRLPGINRLYWIIFLDADNLRFGLACSVLAQYWVMLSIVFYNAFLPEISGTRRICHLGAGFGTWIWGGVFCWWFIFLMITFPEWFGISDDSLRRDFRS